LFVEQAKINEGSPPLMADVTTSLDTMLCKSVVLPVPGGPLTAKISPSFIWLTSYRLCRCDMDKGNSYPICPRCFKLASGNCLRLMVCLSFSTCDFVRRCNKSSFSSFI